MMKYMFIILAVFVVTQSQYVYALSDRNYKAYMQRADFRDADNHMNHIWKKIKPTVSSEQFKNILSNQRAWVKKGREEEVKYLKKNYPYYDTCRLYAISTTARSVYLGEIIDYIGKNPSSNTDKLANFMKSINYIDLLDYLAPELERKYGATSENDGLLVHCSYQNDNSWGSIMGFASDVLSFFTGTKAQVASIATGLISNMSTHTLQCSFRPNVFKYSVAYFYSGLTDKFRTKETHELKDKRTIKISTTTGKSTLDFVTIRADTIDNGEVFKTLYAFQLDPENNRIIEIDPQEFLSSTVNEYKE